MMLTTRHRLFCRYRIKPFFCTTGPFLGLLDNFPQAPVAFSDELYPFIETHALFGLGIGLIDVHLLASTRLAIDARLWTRDKRLLVVADRF